jgi:hypothetical protein
VKHSAALAALVVTSLSLVALPTFAQDTTTTTPAVQKADRQIHRMVYRDAGPGPRAGGILGLVCSDHGAEALEIAFVHWSHALELTAEQQPLFDALKTNALTTQTSFADQCQAAMPDRTADAKPDLLEVLKARLAIEEAKLTAMNDLLPDFEAFYASLTDAQKADLMPRGFGHDDNGPGDRMGRGDGHDRGGPGRMFRMPAPGRS